MCVCAKWLRTEAKSHFILRRAEHVAGTVSNEATSDMGREDGSYAVPARQPSMQPRLDTEQPRFRASLHFLALAEVTERAEVCKNHRCQHSRF